MRSAVDNTPRPACCLTLMSFEYGGKPLAALVPSGDPQNPIVRGPQPGLSKLWPGHAVTLAI